MPPDAAPAAPPVALRSLPAVDAVLAQPALERALDAMPRNLVVDAVRAEIAEARRVLRNGAAGDAEPPGAAEIASSAAGFLRAAAERPLRPVINATGVVVHTNLGRAPLSEAAVQAMSEISAGYSNLEFDLENGTRGSRHRHADWLLRSLTGAEASLVVNNNAAALLLALSAHAQHREVIVSRGQAVEIGGGFRIPDVLRQSGARLVEVGTTNRTRADDYADAATPQTAAILRVHTSNFRIVGFTETPTLQELRSAADNAGQSGALLIDDIDSGCLLDTATYGLAPEPTPQDSIAAGADLVMFSGDKLLGGPQAGIIVGRESAIAPLRSHPLMRVLRPDKAALAGLIATLEAYLAGNAERDIPVWQMIAADQDEIAERAVNWASAASLGEIYPDESPIGGGSLPGETRPTHCWSPKHIDPLAAAAALRDCDPAIIARVHRGRLFLDPRTVLPGQDAHLISTVRHYCNNPF